MNSTKLRSTLAALAMLPAAGLAVAAGPTEGCQDLGDGALACEKVGYFDCSDAIGGKVKEPLSPVGLVSAAPATSFTAGAGCGFAETPGLTGTAQHSLYDLGVAGLIDANIDTLTVELHSIYAAVQRFGGDVELSVRLAIDDRSPAGSEISSGTTGDIASAIAFPVTVTPVVSASGASESFVFTITDLAEKFPELIKTDNTRNRHSIQLTVDNRQLDFAGAYVWGASEIPANITVNGEVRGTVLSALNLG